MGDKMARRFKHLTKTDRLKIEVLDKQGYTKTQIASILGVHNSTISRELRRGRYVHTTDFADVDRYSPDIAQQRYRQNLLNKGPGLKIGNDYKLAEFIEDKMVNDNYSVDAVLGYIKKNNMSFSVSITRQTLYRYIDMGLFINLTNKNLPVKGRRKKKKRPVRVVQAKACVGDSIEKRPSHINTREEFGHWEMDTVVGKRGESKHSLLVLTERKTREELIFLLTEHTAAQVVSCIDRLELAWGDKFSKVFKTITVDNGKEFSDCVGIQRSAIKECERTKVYYCHAYSSYERGSNENQNKLIRRKIPKGSNFDDKTEEDIKSIEVWINNYPRSLFDFETSQMQFDKELAIIA